MTSQISTNAADHIYRLRIGNKSMRNYTSKMNTVKSFIRNEYSKELGVDIFVPFDLEVVKKLFGWLSTNTSLTIRGRKQKHADIEENSDIDNDDIYAVICHYVNIRYARF